MKEKCIDNYDSALDFIYSRRKFAKSSDLQRISALLSELSFPQKKLCFVHVVGTNGKGSTANMISRCLFDSGLTVGLFTSPFIIDFTERIQINNHFVDKTLFCRCTEKVRLASEKIERDGLSPTSFETVLAVALLCFKESGCDIVVLEAGIGGRNDSTNVIPAPEATVITSISLDHTEMLGETVREIAEAKCGVIKSGTTVVSFPDKNGGFDFVPQPAEALRVVRGFCSDLSVPLVIPDMSGVISHESIPGGREFSYKGINARLSLLGDHQLANACAAIETLRLLGEKGFPVNDSCIETGLSKTVMPGRMEIFKHKGKTVILDGGHNPGCMTAIAKMLRSDFCGQKISAIMGFMKDKDYASSLEIIASFLESIIFVPADLARGENPSVLAGAAEPFCRSISTENNASDALKKALNDDCGVILVAGSFYLVSEMRKILTKPGY